MEDTIVVMGSAGQLCDKLAVPGNPFDNRRRGLCRGKFPQDLEIHCLHSFFECQTSQFGPVPIAIDANLEC
jgi:hypothetical protein